MKMRDDFEILVGSSDISDIKVIHGQEMAGVIGKQAVAMDGRKIFHDDICRRRDNAQSFGGK